MNDRQKRTWRDSRQGAQLLAGSQETGFYNIFAGTLREVMQGQELRRFVEHAPMAAAMFDHGMVYMAASPLWRSDYHVSEEIVGRSHYDVFPETPERWRDVHRRALAGEIVSAPEDRLLRADGSTQWIQWQACPWSQVDGKIGGIIIFVEDITRRKEAEEALKESSRRLLLAQSAAQIGIWDWNLLTDEAFINDEYRDIYGLSRDCSVSYQDFLSRVHPEDRAWVDSSNQAAVTDHGRIDLECRIVRANDGAARWVAAKAKVYCDDDGRPVRVAGAVCDITERKLTEHALRESETSTRRQRDELEWIYQNAPIGLCFFDLDLRYRRVNRWLAEINGLPVEAHIGQNVRDVVPAIAPRIEEVARRIITTGAAMRNEEVSGETSSQPGATRYFNDSWHPALDEKGSVVGFIVMVEEITEKKRVEALREADRRKNEFLATLAHELRNPLATISLTLDRIRERTQDDPTAREKNRVALERAQRQVKHLVWLVEDLLAISRITYGKIKLARERIDLRTLLPQAVDLIQQKIKAKNHHMSVALAAEPLMVNGDAVRLIQVFGNLLDNAAKYTDRGGRIELNAARDSAEVVVTVRDNGIGILPENLSLIFEVFSQIKSGPDRTGDGIGIGLALARKLIELHHGRIEAHSAGLGLGSEFIVRLPLEERGKRGDRQD